MNVLIIEDEGQTAERLKELILRYDKTIRILDIIPSVEKTLAYFNKPQSIRPDLIFLDIHLEDDLGFRILEELKLTTPIIFTTAFADYMLKAFKTYSIDYLLKPVDFEELSQSIDKFRTIVHHNLGKDRFQEFLINYEKPIYKDRFMVSSGTRLQSIDIAQIAYFSYERRCTLVNTTDGKFYDLDYSLEKLVELIDPKQFFRVNRNFIVSLTSISSINQYQTGKLLIELNPKARSEVSVSIDRITLFKEWLGK